MTLKVPDLSPEQKFWLSLEMERTDRSYLSPKRIPTPDKVVITRKVYPKRAEQEKREQLMFNAGRYAAGARDKTAETAHLWLERQLDS